MLTEFTVLWEGHVATFSKQCSDRPGLIEGEGVQVFEMTSALWNEFCNGRTSKREWIVCIKGNVWEACVYPAPPRHFCFSSLMVMSLVCNGLWEFYTACVHLPNCFRCSQSVNLLESVVKRVHISGVVFRNDKRSVILYSFRRMMASVVVMYLLLIYLLVKIHRKTTKESMLFPVNTKSAMAKILDCINNWICYVVRMQISRRSKLMVTYRPTGTWNPRTTVWEAVRRLRSERGNRRPNCSLLMVAMKMN